jgi:phage recombination protein Bet
VKALVEAIFPNAQSAESVILALSYCRARNLDPFKRNVHIVPIWDKQRRCLVDTIWPGIGELRTTAFRTGEYAGRDDAAYGPDVVQKVGRVDLKFPQWCQVTVYRMVKGQRMAFSGPKVYWLETYSTAARDDDSPNEMWATRTYGQIEKCAEAAALRAAFPEEIGTDYISDEIRGSERGPTRGEIKVESKTAQLASRFAEPSSAVVAHPTSEAHVIDTSTSNLPPDEQQHEHTEPEVTGADAEPVPVDLPDLSTMEKFTEAMESVLAGCDDFGKRMAAVKLNYPVQRDTQAALRARADVYTAAVRNRLGADGKIQG